MKHFSAITAMATGLMFSLGSATAATYSVDFFLADNAAFSLTTPGGTSNFPIAPMHVTGEITTDGTLGALDASNFVSWNFEVSGSFAFSESSAFGQSNDPSNGIVFSVENSGLDAFTATATELVAGQSAWNFGARLDTGIAVNVISFGVLDARQGLTFAASTQQGTTELKNTASELSFSFGTVAIAAPAPVPLPASLPMIIGALSIFGLMGRRRA